MIVFATLSIPVSDDPEIYAATPIIEWQHSEVGTWVMEHAIETPSFRIRHHPDTWGDVVDIYGKLSEQDEVYYRLKYGFNTGN